MIGHPKTFNQRSELMNQDITRIGIDLAKNIFQVCATNAAGKVVFNQTVKRAKLTALMANQNPCEVVLEACATANYWARVFQHKDTALSLSIQLMSAPTSRPIRMMRQMQRPYVKQLPGLVCAL
jgi:hypothetical protein